VGESGRVPGGDFEVRRHPVVEGLRALRPHQWAKNLLVFVPLALTPGRVGEPALQLGALAAFVAFSLVASAGYLVNDLLDLEADRRHPEKCKRPFASGALGARIGVGLAIALVLGAVVLVAAVLPGSFAGVLGTYLVLTLVYSAYLKRFLMLDVILLAGLYTLRLIGGAVAVTIGLTPWLLAFALFIFLSLAFAKRYSELHMLAARREVQAERRAYRVEDLDLVAALGASSGYMSVLVLCLYINSEAVRGPYHTVELLWFLCPILLYWISRIWFLAKRGELPGDPVAFAIRDPASWLSGGLMGVVFVLAIS
jgi:4-hydroxybenzoate polyprenyltransferase